MTKAARDAETAHQMRNSIPIDEASQLTGYAPDHLRGMCRAGKLGARRIGRTWQIDRRMLLSYISFAVKLALNGDRKRLPHPPMRQDEAQALGCTSPGHPSL